MKSNHTPGPWHFAGSGIITNEDGDEIALGNLYEGHDAQLVLSAPELLAALESIHLKCTFEHVTDWRQLRNEIGQLCVEALAKVEGKIK